MLAVVTFLFCAPPPHALCLPTAPQVIPQPGVTSSPELLGSSAPSCKPEPIHYPSDAIAVGAGKKAVSYLMCEWTDIL